MTNAITFQTLENEIRKTPLAERLENCKKIIGKMCSEGRPPAMSIPPQSWDEDIIFNATLEDCLELIETIKAIDKLVQYDYFSPEEVRKISATLKWMLE